jgi:hypothetical protein
MAIDTSASNARIMEALKDKVDLALEARVILGRDIGKDSFDAYVSAVGDEYLSWESLTDSARSAWDIAAGAAVIAYNQKRNGKHDIDS